MDMDTLVMVANQEMNRKHPTMIQRSFKIRVIRQIKTIVSKDDILLMHAAATLSTSDQQLTEYIRRQLFIRIMKF